MAVVAMVVVVVAVVVAILQFSNYKCTCEMFNM